MLSGPDIQTFDVDALDDIRSRCMAAAKRVDLKTTGTEDLETLYALDGVIQAIGSEFERRADGQVTRAAAADKLAQEITAAAQVPAPKPSRLPSMGQLARNAPRRTRPVGRGSRGLHLLTASGEQSADEQGWTEEIGRAVQTEFRMASTWPDTSQGDQPGRAVLASIKIDHPEDRWLSKDSEGVNVEKIAAVTSPEVLAASGGVCAPVAVSYDVSTIATSDRPVKSYLAQFGASRGGLRYVLPHTPVGSVERRASDRLDRGERHQPQLSGD